MDVPNESGQNGRPLVPASKQDLISINSQIPPRPETAVKKTASQVINEFIQRRHRVRVFKESRILFDPKSLPGISPQEALDFLIKGLKLEDSDAEGLRQILTSERAQEIREHFTEFIAFLTKQNNDLTVADIWRVDDIDPMMKMALQWEIQGVRQGEQRKDEYIESSAAEVAADLRKFDASLKAVKGSELMIRYNNTFDDIEFTGFNISDGNGLGFAENQDPNDPYHDLVINGHSAFSGRDWLGSNFENLKSSTRLVIPLKARDALRTRPTAEDFQFSCRSSFQGRQYEQNKFVGVIFGDEITSLRESPGNAFLYNNYQHFKDAAVRVNS